MEGERVLSQVFNNHDMIVQETSWHDSSWSLKLSHETWDLCRLGVSCQKPTHSQQHLFILWLLYSGETALTLVSMRSTGSYMALLFNVCIKWFLFFITFSKEVNNSLPCSSHAGLSWATGFDSCNVCALFYVSLSMRRTSCCCPVNTQRLHAQTVLPGNEHRTVAVCGVGRSDFLCCLKLIGGCSPLTSYPCISCKCVR